MSEYGAGRGCGAALSRVARAASPTPMLKIPLAVCCAAAGAPLQLHHATTFDGCRMPSSSRPAFIPACPASLLAVSRIRPAPDWPC